MSRPRLLTIILGLSLFLAPEIRNANADEPAAVSRLLVKGDFESPRFSPDASKLLLSSERFQKLILLSLEDGQRKVVTKERGASVSAGFLPDGRVVFESKRAGKNRTLVRDEQGVLSEIPARRNLAFAHRGRVYLRSGKGPILLGTGDTFFAPIVSPDGKKIVFSGLATGLHVYDITTGKTLRVGPGTEPSWSPDSSRLVYEWTIDDGHRIHGSELWLWHTQSGSRPLTATPDTTERHPSFSPDGKSIVFDDSLGAIYMLQIGAQQ